MDPTAQARAILFDAVAAGTGSAAAAAVQRGGALTCFAVGQTALPQWPHAPVATTTAFDLASLTKPMATLTLLARQLGAGRIALTDRLDAHVPAARHTPRGEATIGALMSHTSGAPAWIDYFAATRDVAPDRRAAAVQEAVFATPNEAASGVRAVYSDLGYMALGWLLEHVCGQPLDVLFAEQIARPLGLRAGYRRISARLPLQTDVVATEVWPARCPSGLPLRGEVHDDNCAALDGVAGHAGLFASVEDVAAWADCWLQAASERGDRRVSALELPAAMCQKWIASAGCEATSWRHGWDTPSQPGSSAGARAPSDAFGHLGFTGTSVWLSPAANQFIVLLTNRVHPTREAVAGIRALRPSLHDALWPASGSGEGTSSMR